MQTDQQAEKLYQQYERFILPTIYKQYPLYKSFAATHGLELDDLIQYGRIGLYGACKSFDEAKGMSMRSHAIQRIIWMINDELTKDSLNNIDNKSLVLLDKNSLDLPVSSENGEELCLHDVIGEEENGYVEIEVEGILNSLGNKLPDQLFKVVEMRYKGHTFKEIGAELGVSDKYCHALLNRNKSIVSNLILA